MARDLTGAAASILKGVLDDLTPEYKAQWDALSPQPRRIVALFTRMGRAATPTELADCPQAVKQENSGLSLFYVYV